MQIDNHRLKVCTPSAHAGHPGSELGIGRWEFRVIIRYRSSEAERELKSLELGIGNRASKKEARVWVGNQEMESEHSKWEIWESGSGHRELEIALQEMGIGTRKLELAQK